MYIKIFVRLLKVIFLPSSGLAFAFIMFTRGGEWLVSFVKWRAVKTREIFCYRKSFVRLSQSFLLYIFQFSTIASHAEVELFKATSTMWNWSINFIFIFTCVVIVDFSHSIKVVRDIFTMQVLLLRTFSLFQDMN